MFQCHGSSLAVDLKSMAGDFYLAVRLYLGNSFLFLKEMARTQRLGRDSFHIMSCSSGTSFPKRVNSVAIAFFVVKLIYD